LRISEQYLEAVQEVLSKSSVMMIPEEKGSDNMMSPKNVAQIVATYKHVMGNTAGGASALGDALFGGNDTELLKRIVRDLEDVKG
jgi:hypothetical protein